MTTPEQRRDFQDGIRQAMFAGSKYEKRGCDNFMYPDGFPTPGASPHHGYTPHKWTVLPFGGMDLEWWKKDDGKPIDYRVDEALAAIVGRCYNPETYAMAKAAVLAQYNSDQTPNPPGGA